MRRRTGFTAARVLATVAAVVTLPGCATKGDMRDLQTELRSLAARQDTLIERLRRDNRSTQDTLRQASDQLFNLRGDVSSQLQQIARSLSELQAMVGENQRGIARVGDQMANLRRPGGDAGTTLGPVSPSQPNTGGVQGGGGAEETYNAGVAEFNRNSLGAARIAFEMVLRNYPNHRLAAHASFYLADILFQEGDLPAALNAFQQIQVLYPTSEKVPDALYRMGSIQLELGRTADARATLQRVVNTYPDSGSAALAREKLAEIR